MNDVLLSIRLCANAVFEGGTVLPSTSTFADPHAVQEFDVGVPGAKAVSGMKKGFRHIAEVGALDASAIASTRVVTFIQLAPKILAKNVGS